MKLEEDKQFKPSKDLVSKILLKYNLHYVTYTAATSGIENTTLIVTTTTNKIVVRIYRLGKKSLDDIKRETNFVMYLKESEIKVPIIYKNIADDYITQIESNDTTWQIIVMEYIEGEHAERYTTNLLKEIAHTHAKMHLASSVYNDVTSNDDINMSLHEDYFLHLIDKNKLIDKDVRSFLDRAEKYSVELDPILPSGLCHLDYDKDNIIVNNNTVAAVLDFDDLAHSPFVVCLGYTLWHIWRYAGKSNVDVYISEYETIRLLTSLEKQYLHKVIVFRHYMISDLKILYGHTSHNDITSFVTLEAEINKYIT